MRISSWKKLIFSLHGAKSNKNVTAGLVAPITLGLMLFSNSSTAASTDKISNKVNLLQDEFAIACATPLGKSESLKIWIDRKDREMTLTRGKQKENFQSLSFLDNGVLFRSATSEKVLAFHILENGETLLVFGNLREFSESNCDDTGNSKLCKIPKGGKILWTPEVLKFAKAAEPASTSTTPNGTSSSELEKFDLSGPIWRYGVFPNDATYFHAKTSDKTALMLIDFGSEIKLIEGDFHQLSCSYEK